MSRDGAGVGGDVLADRAVAARRGRSRGAVLVAQAEQDSPSIFGSAVKASGSSSAFSLRKRRMRSTNSATSSSAKPFASDSIGTRWRTLANFSDASAPTFSAEAVGALELGERLQRLVAPAQGVVLGVRDGRRVLLVIAPVVLGDLPPERLMLDARFKKGQGVEEGVPGRCLRGHRLLNMNSPRHAILQSFLHRGDALAAGKSAVGLGGAAKRTRTSTGLPH